MTRKTHVHNGDVGVRIKKRKRKHKTQRTKCAGHPRSLLTSWRLSADQGGDQPKPARVKRPDEEPATIEWDRARLQRLDEDLAEIEWDSAVASVLAWQELAEIEWDRARLQRSDEDLAELASVLAWQEFTKGMEELQAELSTIVQPAKPRKPRKPAPPSPTIVQPAKPRKLAPPSPTLPPWDDVLRAAGSEDGEATTRAHQEDWLVFLQELNAPDVPGSREAAVRTT